MSGAKLGLLMAATARKQRSALWLMGRVKKGGRRHDPGLFLFIYLLLHIFMIFSPHRPVNTFGVRPPAMPPCRPLSAAQAGAQRQAQGAHQTTYQKVSYCKLRFLFRNVSPRVCPELDQCVHVQSVPGAPGQDRLLSP